MKKRLTLLSLLLSSFVVTWAGEELHLHTLSGGEVVYDFSVKPVITFNASDMILTTSQATVVYPLADVTSFTFSYNDSESLEQITSSEPSGDATVRIYSIDGQLIKIIKDADGVSHLPLNDLSAGSYVVKSNQRSFTIIKK